MASGPVGAVGEQQANGFRLAAFHHAREGRLPIVKTGFTRNAFREGALEGGGVAGEDIGDTVELVVLEGVEEADGRTSTWERGDLPPLSSRLVQSPMRVARLISRDRKSVV